MTFEFSENSVIVIPFIHKGCRLDKGERLRFRCLFKNSEGDYPYTLDIEEDNKGEEGADGKYTISIDSGAKGILPGRYQFDLSLVLASGALVTLKNKNECCIKIIPAAEGLYKPNGEVYFFADYIVEQGISGIWTYRKWASGVAECWGQKTVTTAIADAAGSIFMSPVLADSNIQFPFSFTETPLVLTDMQASEWVILIARGTPEPTPSSTGGVRLMRGSKMEEEAAFILNYTVKGRWK